MRTDIIRKEGRTRGGGGRTGGRGVRNGGKE